MNDFALKPLIKRFAIAYVLASVALTVVYFLLEKFIGYSANGGTGIIPVMVAAMDMGQTFYKQNNRVPEKSESWRLARWATGVVAVVSAVVLLILFVASPQSFAFMGLPGFALIILVVMLISFLAIRFFTGFGAKNLAKAEARKNSA